MIAANTAEGALLLVKKLGSIAPIVLGIIGIAFDLEYRAMEFSPGTTGAGIVAVASSMTATR